MPAITTWQALTRDFERTLATRADDAFSKRETAYFRQRIGTVKSVEAFVADRRLLSYAMKAHGLGEMTYATAFVRKVLVEGVDASGALANRLADPRFRNFARAFNFARHGALATTFEAAQSETVEKYRRVTLEEDVGRTDEGVRLALYFERMAPTIDTAMQALADPALARFARVVAGLPEAVGALDIDRQANLLGEKIDFDRLDEPAFLRKLITNFLARWETTVAPSATTASALPGLATGATAIGFGVDVLMSLQNMRAGGRR